MEASTNIEHDLEIPYNIILRSEKDEVLFCYIILSTTLGVLHFNSTLCHFSRSRLAYAITVATTLR